MRPWRWWPVSRQRRDMRAPRRLLRTTSGSKSPPGWAELLRGARAAPPSVSRDRSTSGRSGALAPLEASDFLSLDLRLFGAGVGSAGAPPVSQIRSFRYRRSGRRETRGNEKTRAVHSLKLGKPDAYAVPDGARQWTITTRSDRRSAAKADSAVLWSSTCCRAACPISRTCSTSSTTMPSGQTRSPRLSIGWTLPDGPCTLREPICAKRQPSSRISRLPSRRPCATRLLDGGSTRPGAAALERDAALARTQRLSASPAAIARHHFTTSLHDRVTRLRMKQPFSRRSRGKAAWLSIHPGSGMVLQLG